MRLMPPSFLVQDQVNVYILALVASCPSVVSSNRLIVCQQPSNLASSIPTITTSTASPISIKGFAGLSETLMVMSPAVSLEQRGFRAILSEGMLVTQLPEDSGMMAAALSLINPAQDTWGWSGPLVGDTTRPHG